MRSSGGPSASTIPAMSKSSPVSSPSTRRHAANPGRVSISVMSRSKPTTGAVMSSGYGRAADPGPGAGLLEPGEHPLGAGAAQPGGDGAGRAGDPVLGLRGTHVGGLADGLDRV